MADRHHVKEIAFISYPVKDMKRADHFYQNVLGLTPGIRTEGEFGIWYEYDIANGTLALGQMKGWEPGPGGGSAALEVEDFNATVAHLKKNGVKFILEPCKTSVCTMAVIEDTEGNSLTIHKRDERPA